jgi:hypothetical protein
VTVIQFYAECGVGQGFKYRAFHFNVIFLCHNLFKYWEILNGVLSLPHAR